MIGFVTIVKWLSVKPGEESCRTMESSIRSTSSHNDHFNNLGEPLNKFVYFNTSLCEYNVIFLYPDGEDGVIKQFDDYLNNYDDKEFPQELIKSKYGDSETYNVIFKPIEIDNKLLTCLRTCQYLGYMKYMDRDKFDTIKINSKKDLLDFAQKEKVEDNWIFTKTPPDLDRDVQIKIETEKDFIFYIAEKYGQGLNKGDRKLSDLGEQSKWNYFSIVEQELIESIQNAKTLEFKKLKLERSFFK